MITHVGRVAGVGRVKSLGTDRKIKLFYALIRGRGCAIGSGESVWHVYQPNQGPMSLYTVRSTKNTLNVRREHSSYWCTPKRGIRSERSILKPLYHGYGSSKATLGGWEFGGGRSSTTSPFGVTLSHRT